MPEACGKACALSTGPPPVWLLVAELGFPAPKFHFGTPLSEALLHRAGSHGADEALLRGPVRSQVQLGNEVEKWRQLVVLTIA